MSVATRDLVTTIQQRHKQRWTLRFTDDAVEAEYLPFIYKRVKNIIKIASVLTLILHPFFGILDYLVSDKYLVLWFIRFVIGMPLLIIGCILAFSPKYYNYHQLYAVATAQVLALSVNFMIIFGDMPVSIHYYSGIYVVIFFASVLFFIRFIYVIFLVISNYIFYLVIVLYIKPLYEEAYFGFFFMSASLSLCLITGYFIEYALRQYFIKTKVEQALFESESANKAKNDFLAVMNHELRSPLIAIKGFSEVAIHELVGDMAQHKEVYKDYAREINTSADHLLHIINDILDYSKVSSGKVTLQSSDFSAQAVLEETARMLQPQAQAKSLDVTIDAAEDIMLTADRQLTKQMLINLLSNAIKFSPEGKRITLAARQQEEGIVLSVTDEGVGIAPQDHAKVLEPFIQIDDPFSREQATLGTGLGLPFVKKVMELHGGKLRLHSQVQQGTMVELVFLNN